MKKTFYTRIILSYIFCITWYGCKTTHTSSAAAQEKSLNLILAVSPIKLSNSGYKFYKDIPYGEFKENVFDIFLPASKQPASLVINIHGGGFINGDKAQGNQNSALINSLLSNNIAFASINYRFLTAEDGEGVLKCLNDSKRALQFIRYYSKSLNIDKNNVILTGGSAGAGTSLWIGFNDDMADKKNADPVLRESTRVKAVVALNTQADYDVLEWHNNVFKEYQSQGLDQKYLMRLGTQKRVLAFYGFKNPDEINSTVSKAYRNKVSMLKLMSNDDPEIYVENVNIPYKMPATLGELEHHPLHAKALMDKAVETHIKGTFYIPKMNIDTRKGEDKEDFIVRVLGKGR